MTADYRRPKSILARRTFLTGSIAAAVAHTCPSAAETAPRIRRIPIIDTHIHLFDVNRPQGAPYRGALGTPSNNIGASPARYEALIQSLGIVGAIAIEASPWIEDNLWLLQSCGKSKLMVGIIGNLRPEVAEFPEYLDRFSKNPLFRGIRYGNLWNYDLVMQSRNPAFLEGLRRLAGSDLILETANPRVDLLQAIVRVSDFAPDLRVVIDHLPKLESTGESEAAFEAVLRELHVRPNVFAKFSAVIHDVAGHGRVELSDHRARLDRLYETFEENRILFGSDWPNSEGNATMRQIVDLMRQYFCNKSITISEKFFWQNSICTYKWSKRLSDQPTLSANQAR